MKKIIIIGAGGHCKVIIDIIKSINKYEIVGIIDNNVKGHILGIPIIGDDNILKEVYEENIRDAFIAIGSLGNLKFRNVIYNKLKNIGFNLPILVHKTAIVSPFAKIQEGTCIMARATINPSAQIGKNCIINTGSVIEHDCFIGNNTHVSSNVSMGGEVKVGANTHIGIGSCIIQGKIIEDNVTIGAGAVVVDNIKKDSIAVGIPAKVIKVKS
ncbi:acetyltransferase [Clostridium botulinum]|uniref:Acetyltransferase n=1 Tax=Clostridium botulinum TaxID=1491 RepID=A0A846JWR6_CLOBO|nr:MULTISPECIES: acetyltransferase [Clostridium]KAI3345911.1 acetyltransferase [Clostridium botulinum]KOM88526.1 serine acetyltransferase [Clostridium botulinum]KOR55184.1 serine acetyltransferase [Clostridium botulinum]MBN1034639.1 serine acetyltransferase [Clostridium botulinum]MBY7023860.1 acetyltransferase [Clostridium botulinum]